MVKSVVEKKVLEIEAGVDGFMVYDFDLVPIMNQVFLSAFPENLKTELKTF